MSVATSAFSSSFHIRPIASTGPPSTDSNSVLSFVDSQLPYLASIGSGAQWGSQLHVPDPAAQARYLATIERIKTQAAEGYPFGEDWVRGFVAESRDTEGKMRAVAAVVLEGKAASYAQTLLQAKEEPFVYVRFLVTDRSAGTLSKGAGKVLLRYVEKVARELGLSRLCLDCWRGNERRLVKYYEQLGYVALGDADEKKKDGDVWRATVMEKKI